MLKKTLTSGAHSPEVSKKLEGLRIQIENSNNRIHSLTKKKKSVFNTPKLNNYYLDNEKRKK
jgi:hypothetical protein